MRFLILALSFFLTVFLQAGNVSEVRLVEVKMHYDPQDDNYILYKPSQIFVADNRIYVTDIKKKTIAVFSTEGKFLKNIGRGGDGPGEFRKLHNIFVTRKQIYVCDEKKVQIFDLQGKLIKVLKIDFDPHRILVGNNGKLYLLMFYVLPEKSPLNLIRILSEEGKEIGSFFPSVKHENKIVEIMINSINICQDSKGNIYTAFEGFKNQIVCFDANGKKLFEYKIPFNEKGPFKKVDNIEIVQYMWSMTCGPQDNLYVLVPEFVKEEGRFVYGKKIYVFNSKGNHYKTLLLPMTAYCFAVDVQGNIYVIDAEEFTLHKCVSPEK